MIRTEGVYAIGAWPRAGDFAVVRTGTRVTRLISSLETLDDLVNQGRKGGWDEWDHAVVCVSAPPAGDFTRPFMIVEAEPGGAVRREWHYQDVPHRWSSGIVPLTDGQREGISACAEGLAGGHTGYGWLDYAALLAHGLHVPVPGLREFIKSTKTMICSQLVDYSYASAGVQLFNDGRYSGYVKPSDLGWLLR